MKKISVYTLPKTELAKVLQTAPSYYRDWVDTSFSVCLDPSPVYCVLLSLSSAKKKACCSVFSKWLPSCVLSLFENESLSITLHMEMNLLWKAMKSMNVQEKFISIGYFHQLRFSVEDTNKGNWMTLFTHFFSLCALGLTIELNLIYRKCLLRPWKGVHPDSFWKSGKKKDGNGLLEQH